MTSWLTSTPSHAGLPLLVCVPHAGGTAALFRAWSQELAGVADVATVLLPGRERRTAEPPVDSRDELVGATADAIVARGTGSVALLGHSLGGIVAFEVARELERRDRAVVRLFVSASAAPSEVTARRIGIDAVSDAELLRWLESIGGVPPEVLAVPVMRSLALATVRADLRLADAYECAAGVTVECPISVTGGVDDATVPVGALDGWRSATSADCVVRRLPGGHFFLGDGVGRSLLLDVIARDLARVGARST